MSMLILIGLLLIGGLVCWLSERLGANTPRWVALASVTVSLLYLLNIAAALPPGWLLATSRAPENPQWQAIHRRWEEQAAQWGLPLAAGVVGNRPVCSASHSTSISRSGAIVARTSARLAS